MSSVGYAWAKVKGRATGDIEGSKKFLSGVSPSQGLLRNRKESRPRGKIRKKGFRLGDTYGRHR